MWTQRKDLIPPCAKGCPGRTATCSDNCQRPEYLEWRATFEKQKEERRARKEIEGYDAQAYARRESQSRTRYK